MHKARVHQILKIVLIAAAFACLAVTFRRSAKDILSIPAPKSGVLALAVALFMLHYVIQSLGWHGILRALGEPTTVQTSTRMWYMSMIARWMPGRIWYSATRLYLARQAGLSLPAVAFATVFELLYIMVGGILVTLLFAGAQMRGVLQSHTGQALLFAVIAIVFAGTAIVLRPGALLRLCRFALFRKCVRRLTGRDLTEEEMPTMSPWASVGLLVYFTVFWIYSGWMFGVLASAFIPMTTARWMACIPAFPGSWLIGFFSIVTPAGIGAREGAMWLMLKHAMPQSYAVILAVTTRLAMLGAELLSVLIVYLASSGAVRVPADGAINA